MLLRTLHSLSTIIFNSLCLSVSRTSASIGSTAVYIIRMSTRRYTSRITNGSCLHHMRAMLSTPWMVLLRACHTTFFPSYFRYRNSPTLRCSSSSTSGQSLFVGCLSSFTLWEHRLIGLPDDGEYVANSYVLNGAACHTMHHLYFNYNYGQFTTVWDRLGGSYRQPNEELFSRESKMSKAEWDRQTKEIEKLQKEVEGDDRNYGDESRRLQKKVL